MRQPYEQWEPTIGKSTGTAVDLKMDEFLELSFSHYIEILNKVTDFSTRNQYIKLTLKHKWSAKSLRQEITENAAEKFGNLPSNFSNTIANLRDAVKALNMFKVEYLLDIINTE